MNPKLTFYVKAFSGYVSLSLKYFKNTFQKPLSKVKPSKLVLASLPTATQRMSSREVYTSYKHS